MISHQLDPYVLYILYSQMQNRGQQKNKHAKIFRKPSPKWICIFPGRLLVKKPIISIAKHVNVIWPSFLGFTFTLEYNTCFPNIFIIIIWENQSNDPNIINSSSIFSAIDQITPPDDRTDFLILDSSLIVMQICVGHKVDFLTAFREGHEYCTSLLGQK